jgi:hypothetical protein
MLDHALPVQQATNRPLTKLMLCKKCDRKVLAKLIRNIVNSGASQVFWLCPICNTNAMGAGQWIDHKKIIASKLTTIENIPVANDYRIDKCVVCGEVGTEYHHFAPKHLFHDEADKWPTAYLCKKHHDQWHRLVTPDMCKRGK